ncbi:MAG: RHS repeat-associated core domain-containing protein [Planctomycetota bacterium]
MGYRPLKSSARAVEHHHGSTITSTTRDQQWTLTHTGNWDYDKLDLNGDGDFVDASEHNDHRTHNDVNELTGRDTDNSGSDNFTLSYDGPGNMTDDGENYTWKYDAFGRLREVHNRSNAALVSEYTYNGKGHLVGVHNDTEPDGDVDSNDPWYYTAYDERWRPLATFRSSDSSPKEEFVLQQAGNGGFGVSSYINSIVCRYKDANTAWTSASDGVLEQVYYYCQNWRGDVSALVTDAGAMVEWDKYSAYGIPFGLPAGDTESDGDCDTTDANQIQTWINGTAYDVRGDLDLDGDVDATDKTTAQNNTKALGRAVLTGCGNRNGYAGYQIDGVAAGTLFHVRHRVLTASLGRWITRDPLGYINGPHLVQYADGAPVANLDPAGYSATGSGQSRYLADCPTTSEFQNANTWHHMCAMDCDNSPARFSAKGRKSCMQKCDEGLADSIHGMLPFGPVNSSSDVCKRYPPNHRYRGIRSRCMCTCMGDSKWAQEARGCLGAAFACGIDDDLAHDACYSVADGTAPEPKDRPSVDTWQKCLRKCAFGSDSGESTGNQQGPWKN